jgi:hypothetical protein
MHRFGCGRFGVAPGFAKSGAFRPDLQKLVGATVIPNFIGKVPYYVIIRTIYRDEKSAGALRACARHGDASVAGSVRKIEV